MRRILQFETRRAERVDKKCVELYKFADTLCGNERQSTKPKNVRKRQFMPSNVNISKQKLLKLFFERDRFGGIFRTLGARRCNFGNVAKSARASLQQKNIVG